jgi:hypothetical protein
MAWLFQLIAAQLIFGYVLVCIMYLIWRLTNPGKKPW